MYAISASHELHPTFLRESPEKSQHILKKGSLAKMPLMKKPRLDA